MDSLFLQDPLGAGWAAHGRYRGTSLIRNSPPPRTTIGSWAQSYCRVLRGPGFLWARCPCKHLGCLWAGEATERPSEMTPGRLWKRADQSRVLSHAKYSFISFGESTPPQNRQLNISISEKTISWGFCGGVVFLELINKYILWEQTEMPFDMTPGRLWKRADHSTRQILQNVFIT